MGRIPFCYRAGSGCSRLGLSPRADAGSPESVHLLSIGCDRTGLGPGVSLAIWYQFAEGLADAGLRPVGSGDLPGIPQQEGVRYVFRDRKSTRLNSSHVAISYAV